MTAVFVNDPYEKSFCLYVVCRALQYLALFSGVCLRAAV